MLTSLLLAGVAATSAHLECTDLPPLLAQMEQAHYAAETVGGLAPKRSVHQFIKSMDSTKSLLLKEDVAKLEKSLPRVFAGMRKGNCGVLQEAAAIVIRRAKADEKTVKKMLSNPGFKIDESVKLELDPDKRDYAKTERERSDRVKRLVHFQISNQILAGTKLKKAKKRIIHRYELTTRRLTERRSQAELPGLYAKAFASSLDPHSDYMSPATLADFRIQMRLSLEGIGAVLRPEDGFTVVQSIVPGGQADKEGSLQPKDKIVAVAQDGEEPVDVIDMDLRDVVAMIRGKKGTKVTLTVLREEPKPRTFEITIVRDKIDVAEQAAKITYETRKTKTGSYKIGILELPSFYGGEGGRSALTDVRRLLEEAKAEKIDGLVLDLSGNGGGLLDHAVSISGLFIDRGNVVATRSSDGEVQFLADEERGAVYTGPMAVMISKASASASEILAGALQDYRRAVVAGGEHTFGKGTVQQLSRLPGGMGALKLTMGMFFRPSGASTQQTGVRSDVVIPSALDGFDIAEDQLDYSLPPQTIQPFISLTARGSHSERYTPVSRVELQQLRSKSTGRVQKSDVMQEIIKDVKKAKEDKGPVELGELRKKAKKDDGEDEEARKKRIEAKQKAFVGEGVDIVVDLIRMRNTRT